MSDSNRKNLVLADEKQDPRQPIFQGWKIDPLYTCFCANIHTPQGHAEPKCE